ncbi:hypothetical protein [Corynebacterium cystitidis]|uniref:Lipoprotein LpqE n=1 Tax=Corynebacterium cystitidis DSM 20524 TaxID=1121357 RepID=A0A1H9W8A2_9CORY|nr:hypothetical protein [Corynebacterium cystitidis]WJY83282.1 hypothetical protein CCYS_11965 [Corynebacterium cystitidis DSM 20524]SES30075.1 hypothetical protein SAMN05661109_02585 [Corynebacterium cystitidis DSM 20524]SNV63913.1 putative secreted protein [Corynebacterium cystitidis]
MKSQKSALRRGAAVSAAALSALLLASCSAGQITQTASQVAPIDGATAFSENDEISVQDVTIVLEDTGDASLKFTATNQDVTHAEHVLESVTVAGQQVDMDPVKPLGYNCTVVAGSADFIDSIPQGDGCVQYVETEVENQDFAYAGTEEVVFNFNTGQITVNAAVSAPAPPAGQVDRGPETNVSNEMQEKLGGH